MTAFLPFPSGKPSRGLPGGRAVLPQKDPLPSIPHPTEGGNRMATPLFPGSLCSPERQPPFLGPITKAAFELDHQMPLGPKMAAPGPEEPRSRREQRTAVGRSAQARCGRRACAQARCGRRAARERAYAQGFEALQRRFTGGAKQTLRAASGRAASTALGLHLLPLRPKPGASRTEGTKGQTHPTLTTKRETGICAVLAHQGVLSLLNRVSYGHNRNSLSIVVYQRTWVRIKCTKT